MLKSQEIGMGGRSGAGVRVVLAGGGSGGHIYPALAIARGLLERDPATRILYVGTRHGLERDLVPQAGLPFRAIRARGLMGRGIGKKIAGLGAALAGVWDAWRILSAERPQVVVGTGGYVAGPVGLAASWKGIPLVIQEQNVWPGLTNRWLARRAQVVLIPYAEAKKNFPPRTVTVVAGNPVYITYPGSPEEARRDLGLDPGAVLLLVTGGSQGARAINRLAGELLPQIMEHPGLGILWATGQRYYQEVQRVIGARRASLDPGRIRIVDYFYEIQKMYRAADVFLGRAGAMTLADLAAFGLPSVLVPSPNVAEDHQTKNARVLAERGAAVVFAESALGPSAVKEVMALLTDGPRRRAMADAAKSLHDPDAQRRILDVITAAATPARKR